jgi:hypothetical protein
MSPLYCTRGMVPDCVRVTGRDGAGSAAGVGAVVGAAGGDVVAVEGAGTLCRSAEGAGQDPWHRAPRPVEGAGVQAGARGHARPETKELRDLAGARSDARPVQQGKKAAAQRPPWTELPLAPVK